MDDEPEIIKILRREEMLQKKDKISHKIFQESELSKNISRSNFDVDISSSDILSEKNQEIETKDFFKEWIVDQEPQTHLIGDNNDINTVKESVGIQKTQQDIKIEKFKEFNTPRTGKSIEKPIGLLEKSQKRRQKKIQSRVQHNKTQLKNKVKGDEQTGFGWKEFGSRRIVFNDDLKEYVYDVIEPQLKKEEEKTKNKIIHLFRIGAEIDVFGMKMSEKIRCLEEALQFFQHQTPR